MRRLLVLASILFLGLPASAGAASYCFENLGTTGCPWKETFSRNQLQKLSCQNLWYVRNSIYDRKGFCFKTNDAKAVFDNSDCWVNNANNINFNQHETRNIARIRIVEDKKGCTP